MNQLLKTIAAISETYCETTFRCSAAFLQGIYAERNSGRRKTRWELNPVEEVTAAPTASFGSYFTHVVPIYSF